ncbi:MAG TPA: glucose-6-phosphate dehydrogenase [Dissulfurispiraceae bacterium]|nr:glucose-6-phosphate dehydrogenase [Dissulfurispiraceae bacterium]
MIEERHDIIDSKYLQSCDIPQEASEIGPHTIVIFGGNGDLSRKKLMPSIFGLWSDGVLPDSFSVLGFGRKPLGDEEFREGMKEAVSEAAGAAVQTSKWNEFSGHLHYLSGDVAEEGTMKQLASKLEAFSAGSSEGSREVIYYMAVPPSATSTIIRRLCDFRLCAGTFNAKIIVEKPFGVDGASARRLNAVLKEAFDESRTYRIDHYLGKETVQNIMFFRFSNAIFEQVWNSRFIDNVQITVAEDIGIGHRGEFYEGSGIVRDIVQNHVMQLIGTIAMEPPVGFTANYIRDEKVKVVRSLRPLDAGYIDGNIVAGQYGPGIINGQRVAGYREEENVSATSKTPTYFAGKFYIDNLRWASVPFFVRCGKRLKRRVTEICMQFRQLPLRLFGRTCDVLQNNVLVMTVNPEEKISLRFNVKYPYSPNQVQAANMDFCYRGAFDREHQDAYSRLLVDCMKGDQTLFVREDMVEATWDVVDPIIERWGNLSSANFPNYDAGSWGPDAAVNLIGSAGSRWLTE